jgi:peptide deformylase
MILKIRTYGDPILRKKCERINSIDGDIRKLASDMLETLKNVSGVGLAANQVGMSKRILVIDQSKFDFEAPPFFVINPEIVEISGDQLSEEGCLSLPGMWENVKRPLKMEIKGTDLEGKEIKIAGEGVLARVLSHEIDHLEGLMFIDHLSSIERKLLSRKLKALVEKKHLAY